MRQVVRIHTPNWFLDRVVGISDGPSNSEDFVRRVVILPYDFQNRALQNFYFLMKEELEFKHWIALEDEEAI